MEAGREEEKIVNMPSTGKEVKETVTINELRNS
jgi:hypothetical protein